MQFCQPRLVRTFGATGAVGVLLAGCSTAVPVPLEPPERAPASAEATASAGGRPTTIPATALTSSVAPAPAPSSATSPPAGRTTPEARKAAPFDAETAHALVARLAKLGPRDAVSGAYRRAADLVADEFGAHGYAVRRQRVPVPAGVSWGVTVPSGTTVNVIADPPGFDAGRPHVVLGAHLDTVPQAPGAEDNASGVAVLVELARMLREQPATLPVRLIAFGAEESRGSGWRWYAFGSRHYTASLGTSQRKAVRAMVSLDRVGRATAAVPVCHGGRGSTAVAQELRAAATDRTRSCVNRASDHVSFERVGVPAARIGSVPYDAYHSSADRTSVVDPAQLRRSGTVVWTWLRSL